MNSRDLPEWLHFEAAINPYGCSPLVVEAIESFARSKQYRHYGDATAESLREQLAEHHKLSADNFVVFNGAGEALAWLFVLNLVLKRGRLITPHPSYERFVEAARRAGGEVFEAALNKDDFSLSIEALIAHAKDCSATLGLISSPNNPTGNLLLDRAGIQRLLVELPQCMWIIDEAYADYAGTTFTNLINEHPNLVVLRTFSKAYGLAGLRVGYAVTNSQRAGELARIRIPWCVNSISIHAAQAALSDASYLRQTLARIAEDSRDFYNALRSVPYLKVYPSAANFFLVQIKEHDPVQLNDYLKERRIRVRTRPDMPSHIRVTSMLPTENQPLLRVLMSFGG
jgi:histidinol-phosphate aminotransferase